MPTTLTEKTFPQMFSSSGGVNGTVVNNQGKIVPAVAPAFEYDPATLEPRGLRTRGPARTNLLTGSQLTVGIAEGTSPPTVASATVDGEACFATTFTPAMGVGYGASRSRGGSGIAANVVVSTTYSMSTYVKLSRPLTGTEAIRVYYTGASGMGAADITAANTAEYAQRFTRAVNQNAALASGAVYPVVHVLGALTSNITVWVCKGQIEAASNASSYIPTTTAAASRTADLIYYENLHLAPWFNKAEGTILLKYLQREVQAGVNVVLLALTRTGNSDRIQVDFVPTNSQVRLVHNVGGASFGVPVSNGNIANVEMTVAVSWKAGRFQISLNGGPVQSNANATLVDFSQPSRMSLGSFSGAGPYDGELRDIAYWPKAANAAELQALTFNTEIISG